MKKNKNNGENKKNIFQNVEKIGFDISHKFCMTCRSLFSGENKKNVSKCLLKCLPSILNN